MSNAEFNLKIVLEGLQVICATPEERKAYFSNHSSLIDDNFDFIVLTYLPGAVDANLIPKETASGIESLFKEADEALSSLNWKQEDMLFAIRPELVKQWQSKAAIYVEQIKAYNKLS